MDMHLREHQNEAIEKLRKSIAEGHRKPLLFACCSFGKTLCAAHMAMSAIDKGNKTLFIVHRRMLAEQTKREFDKCGIHSSIIMAGYETDFNAPVMITTRQTYSRRLQLNDPRYNSFFHDAKLIICDEAHLGISPEYISIFDYYKDRVIVGLTGSPARSDGRGLGLVFDDLVHTIGVQELTDNGFLAPARYFAPQEVDLSGIKITAGDYNKKELQNRMNTVKLNGDVFQNWLKIASGRSTIVFSTGVKHSINLMREFNRNGVPAAHLDAHSSQEERESVMAKFESGEIQVVCNCNLFTEGLSADWVSCIVLAMGTKSYARYVQCVGRGQRIFQGKDDFIVIDHGGNVLRHGFISDTVEWTLDSNEIAWEGKKKREKKEPKPLTCEECGRVFKASPKCPDCGTPVTNYGRKVEMAEAEMVEVGKNKKRYTPEEKRRWYSMLLWYARMKGMRDGWAYHKTVEKCGSFIKNQKNIVPIEPDEEVSRYIKYLNIKYIKYKQKQEALNAA